MSRKLLTVVLILAASFAGLAAPPASGNTVFTPTRFDDPSPPGSCDPSDCSLREAVLAANAAAGPDEISLRAGTYQLSIPGTDEQEGIDGDLDISNDPLTITGQASSATVIDGGGATTSERVLHVFSSATIRGVTIRNSLDDARAGVLGSSGSSLSLDDVVISDHNNTPGGFESGISSGGTLIIANSSVSGNRGGDQSGVGVFHVGSGALTITNSTVSGNEAVDSGIACCVGIWTSTSGPVTLDGLEVTHNRAPNFGQAGISVVGDGPASISNAIVADNVAEIEGAGIFLAAGEQSTISNSTVSGNIVTDGFAGGIYSTDRDVTIRNVTVTQNRTSHSGAGIVQDGGTLTLNNVTVTENTANTRNSSGDENDGGGISQWAGAINMRNSISASNAVGPGGSGPDCFGSITSQGHNILGTTADCDFTASTGDQIGVDPKLGPLANNGGPTPTHALLKGSPAINAGNPAAPGSGGTACEGTDQRGLPRNCDIGAYERVLCGKVAVNVVGTDGKEKLRGTNAADGLYGLGGKDTLNGAGGKDGLCGGKGKDTLKGGGGKDFLKGEQGKDTCIGGGGRDKAKCEKEKKI